MGKFLTINKRMGQNKRGGGLKVWSNRAAISDNTRNSKKYHSKQLFLESCCICLMHYIGNSNFLLAILEKIKDLISDGALIRF